MPVSSLRPPAHGSTPPATDPRVTLLRPQFAPDLVVVSSGFDAAAGDPLGGMRLSPVGYAHMTALL